MIMHCGCKDAQYTQACGGRNQMANTARATFRNSEAACYQDEKYGEGMRVHAPKKGKQHRCTVCGRER